MSMPDGWYPDPTGEVQQRLWSEGQWTKQTRPYPPPNASAAIHRPVAESSPRQEWMADHATENDEATEVSAEPADIEVSDDRKRTSTPVSRDQILYRLTGEGDSRIRLALATNSSASPRVLSRLRNDPDVTVREAVARHPNLSQSTLRSLSRDRYAAVEAAVASNPNVDAELLRRLAASKRSDTRSAVARSPQCPHDVWELLAEDPMKEVRQAVAGATTDPTILEPLTWPGRVNFQTLASAAANPIATPDMLTRLAQVRSPLVRRAVAENAVTPIEVLRVLLNDDSHESAATRQAIERSVVQNPSVTPELLELIARRAWARAAPHVSADVLGAIAAHLRTPVSVLRRLARISRRQMGGEPGSVAGEVRRAACANPAWTVADLTEFLTGDPHMRQGVADNPNTTPEMLDQLAKNRDTGTRESVAANPATSPDTVIALGSSRNVTVKLAVAERVDCPREVLEKLGRNSWVEVRAAVGRNPVAPESMLNVLSQDPEVRVRAATARNPQAPDHLLATLAEDAFLDVRRAVAGNPGAQC